MGNILIYMLIGLGVTGIIILIIFKDKIFTGNLDKIIHLMSNQKYDDAITRLKKIVASDRDNVDAMRYLAECYYFKKDFETASEYYERALSLRSILEENLELSIRDRLVEIHMAENEINQAEKHFKKMVELSPNNSQLLTKIGSYYLEHNMHGKAQEYFEKAVKLNEKDQRALYYLGRLYFEKNNYDNAKHCLESAVSIESSMVPVYYYLGMLDYKAKKYKDALKKFEASMKIPEFRVKSLFKIAIIYEELDEIDSAIEELERAKSSFPGTDKLLEMKLMGAKSQVMQALEIFYKIGELHSSRNNMRGAVKEWEKVAFVDEEYKDVKLKLVENQEHRIISDRLKDFYRLKTEKYYNVCKEILEKLGISISEVSETNKSEIFEASGMMGDNTKVLIRIYRIDVSISENILRSISEKMKETKSTRGICISASPFTAGAQEFTKMHNIDVFGPEQLNELLSDITLY